MERKLKRTQVSLYENQREFLKTVADLATWRLKNDRTPTLGDPGPDVDLSSPVSMAEVLREIVDSIMWNMFRRWRTDEQVAKDEGDLARYDYVNENARTREIRYAATDVLKLNKSGRPNPMAEMPDSRPHVREKEDMRREEEELREAMRKDREERNAA